MYERHAVWFVRSTENNLANDKKPLPQIWTNVTKEKWIDHFSRIYGVDDPEETSIRNNKINVEAAETSAEEIKEARKKTT